MHFDNALRQFIGKNATSTDTISVPQAPTNGARKISVLETVHDAQVDEVLLSRLSENKAKNESKQQTSEKGTTGTTGSSVDSFDSATCGSRSRNAFNV
jgi:hypothetical protein